MIVQMENAAQDLWNFFKVGFFLTGMLATAYAVLHVALLAYEGWKREKKADPELKKSADRAVQEQEKRGLGEGFGIRKAG